MIIIGALCASGKINCPFDLPVGGGGGGGAQRAALTEWQAVGQAKAYLASVSAPSIQRKQLPRRQQRVCRDYGTDVYKEECQKRYRTEVKYTWETVWEWVTVQGPAPCGWPPQGGQWSATYNNATKNWSVVNVTSERGRRYGWTVDDRTGAVTSHQPPC
jgi:hypothetical protein